MSGRQPAARRQRAARASRALDDATDARRHLGGNRLGDPLLSAPWFRAGLPKAHRCAAQGVLDHPGPPDRDLGGIGQSAARRGVRRPSAKWVARLLRCMQWGRLGIVGRPWPRPSSSLVPAQGLAGAGPELAGRGYDLFLTARRLEPLEEVRDEIATRDQARRVEVRQLDVTDDADVATAIAEAAERLSAATSLWPTPASATPDESARAT